MKPTYAGQVHQRLDAEQRRRQLRVPDGRTCGARAAELDDLFVATAVWRVRDRDVVRLRRWLREAA